MKWIPVKDRKPGLEPGPGSLCRNSGFLHVLLRASNDDEDGRLTDIAVLFENGQWMDRKLNPIDDVTHWAEGGEKLDWYEMLDSDNEIPNPAASHG